MKQTALGGPLSILILEDDFFKPGPKAKKSRPLSGLALEQLCQAKCNKEVNNLWHDCAELNEAGVKAQC